MRKFTGFVVVIAALLFLQLVLGSSAFAAKVSKINGKKALLLLEGDSAKAGDVFLVTDPNGKKVALIRIKVVKGDRAVGLIAKGKAQMGWSAKLYEKPSAKNKGKSAETGSTAHTDRSYWGAMVGIAQDTLSVDTNSAPSETVSLKGMAFSIKGLFDYEVFSQVWFRGMTGLEGLKASGTSTSATACENGTACNVDIMYLSFDFWGRYAFSQGDLRPWAGGGFSLMFPAVKKSSALDKGSITNTSVLAIGAGLDWFFSPTFYIPIQVEYDMLPKSETVEASAIALRAGFAVPF